MYVYICIRVSVCVYVYVLALVLFFTRFVNVCVARNRRRRLCNNPKRGSLGASAMEVMNVHSAGNITNTHCAHGSVCISCIMYTYRQIGRVN